MAQSTARKDRAGVHSIDHFTLEVPDLEAARAFFTAFGLRITGGASGLELRATASDHCWGRIIHGPHKRLAYLSFNCYANDFESIRAQVQDAGAAKAERHPVGAVEGLWFHDPDGNLLQVRVGPKTSPDAKTPPADLHGRPGGRGVLGRSQYDAVQPRRLSHVLMFSPDVLRAAAFYQNALGLGLSDTSRDIVAFLHARHGSDHHLVAFAKGAAKGWHHSSWDVPGIEDVGRGAAQMAAHGYTRGWGTGRHVLGSNYFHYVQDPWGSFAEYGADIDYIPAGMQWQGSDWPPEDSLYLWGPDVPSIFLTNTEEHLGA
jgi:catechol 2,3-dioxygenase-like lactoylglutathione lyase family enzyme